MCGWSYAQTQPVLAPTAAAVRSTTASTSTTTIPDSCTRIPVPTVIEADRCAEQLKFGEVAFVELAGVLHAIRESVRPACSWDI